MKVAVASLLLFSLVASAQAGGFGGPAPFRNGSPLTTGVDGSYQAVARGKNLTGVIRFSYSDNNQTTTTAGNFYSMYVDGQQFTGDVQAAINTSTVGGVLENSTSVSSNIMRGSFNGKINQNNPNATFSGNGELTVVNGTSTTSTTNTNNQSTVNGSSVVNTVNAGSGTGEGTIANGGSSPSATSVGEIEADGNGSATSTATATGSTVTNNSTTTATETSPTVLLNRTFKFTGVRNSLTAQ